MGTQDGSGSTVVGEGEAGETALASWAVLKSRPRRLANLAERFQRRVQPSEAAQLEAVAWSLEGWEGGGEHVFYSFETQYQLFHVLGSFRLAQCQMWPGQF